MESIETIRVDSDERGWELHIETDEGDYHFNMHGVAEDLLTQMVAQVGGWLAEGQQAAAEHEHDLRHLDREDEEQWMHESAMEFYRRTGNDGPLRDQADDVRARAKLGE